MLNPDQIGHLRGLRSAGQACAAFDDFQVRTEPVLIPPAAGGTEVLFQAPALSAPFFGPSRLFGTPVDASCLDGIGAWTVDFPARRLVRVEEGRIIGNTAVLDARGRLHDPDPVDTATAMANALQRNATNYQGFVLERQEGGGTATFVASHDPCRLGQDALFFHNLEAANYGSFLIRQLLQMQVPASLAAGIDCYIVPDRTPWFIEACELLGLPERPVYTVREICGHTFKSVTLWSEAEAEGFIPPELRQALLHAIAGPGRRAGPARLYVSRTLSSVSRPKYRQLLNERAVEAAVRQAGYAVVHPETLRLKAQAELFAAAERIIGPSGSGMVNCLFAKPGAQVLDLESFTNNVRQHAKLYASGSLAYAFAFGAVEPGETQPLPFQNWRLPLDTLDEALAWMS